jgi:hypothetical protein
MKKHIAGTGSGQINPCNHCDKLPSKEGHDGCIGKLPSKEVMNACCGHGSESQAYVQRWTSRKLMGKEAINYINENKV